MFVFLVSTCCLVTKEFEAHASATCTHVNAYKIKYLRKYGTNNVLNILLLTYVVVLLIYATYINNGCTFSRTHAGE